MRALIATTPCFESGRTRGALAQRNADALFIQVAPWLQDVRARACAGAVPRRSGAPPALEPAAATPEVLVPVGGAMHGGMTEEDE